MLVFRREESAFLVRLNEVGQWDLVGQWGVLGGETKPALRVDHQRLAVVGEGLLEPLVPPGKDTFSFYTANGDKKEVLQHVTIGLHVVVDVVDAVVDRDTRCDDVGGVDRGVIRNYEFPVVVVTHLELALF